MYFRSWQHASSKMTEKRKVVSCCGFVDYQTFTVETMFCFSSRKAFLTPDKLLSCLMENKLRVMPPAEMAVGLKNQAASTYCTYGVLLPYRTAS